MSNNDVLNASIESQLEEVELRLRSFNMRLADMQAERIRDQLNAQALKDVRQNPVLLDSLAEIQGAAVINALKAKLVELRATRTDFAARYQAAHPRMKALDEQIKSLQTTLDEEVQAVLLGLDRRQASLQTTESGLKKAIAEEREREARLNKLSLDYQRLKRDVDTNGKLYDMVTSRMKEADITSALPFNNVRILDRALVATVPFKPNIPRNLISGLLLGLFLAIALVCSRAALDTTIKTQEDIESFLGVPFLGLLPAIETKKAPASTAIGRAALQEQTLDRDVHVMHNPKSTPAECARFIRTNLMFMSPDKPIKTLVVTSAGSQEGKTTTAVSLSVVMAQAGSRTLIVDTDMRRPRLHRVFDIPNDIGISSVIVGEATLDQAIRKTATENLDVLVCGPMPPNPAELLHTDRFRELVAELAKRYDRVIFDTPPAGPVTDPVVLGTHVDGTILVVKCEKTNKDIARLTIRMLTDAQARVLGAVLNDVDIHAKRYGRAYYSYYSRYAAYYGGDKAAAQNPAG
jgi:capsular exopolysaccharide synthesis family protein